jgi:hypothetical protein
MLAYHQHRDSIRKKFIHEYPGDVGGSYGVSFLDDPTYLGFDLSFGGNQEGLFTNTFSDAGPNTALGYLQRRDPTRANYLWSFISGFQMIQTERKYYFQTISGLNEAWIKDGSTKDPFVGTEEGAGITIGCLEALDLKMTALFNLYRMAVWDSRYRRYVVPENLRHFDLQITVQEVRNFKNVIRPGGTGDKVIPGQSPESGEYYKLTQQDYLNANMSAVIFKLSECEFDPSCGSMVFDTVNNQSGEFASTSMLIGYGNIQTIGSYSGLGQQLWSDDSFPSDEDKAHLRNIGKKTPSNANQGKIDTVVDANKAAGKALTNYKYGEEIDYGSGVPVMNKKGKQNNTVKHFEPAPQPSGLDTSKIHDELPPPKKIEDLGKMKDSTGTDKTGEHVSKEHTAIGSDPVQGHKGGSDVEGGLGGAAGFLAGQVTGLASAVGGLAKSFGQNVVLGRVHGLQGEIRAAINNPQALTNLAVGAAAQLAESEGKTISAVIGENIHPDIDFHGTLQGNENILGLGPPGPGPLEPSNIHDD